MKNLLFLAPFLLNCAWSAELFNRTCNSLERPLKAPSDILQVANALNDINQDAPDIPSVGARQRFCGVSVDFLHPYADISGERPKVSIRTAFVTHTSLLVLNVDLAAIFHRRQK